jgi:hypothetical protein
MSLKAYGIPQQASPGDYAMRETPRTMDFEFENYTKS